MNNHKNIEDTFYNLSRYQENLLKNHSNPVFSNEDKNKILKQFTNLQNIKKSLYRYNTLSENDYQKDAEAEKSNIENTVLKGGISYNKYVWHSENGEQTCDVCKSLDGRVFDFTYFGAKIMLIMIMHICMLKEPNGKHYCMMF